jgi:hypothetical protein
MPPRRSAGHNRAPVTEVYTIMDSNKARFPPPRPRARPGAQGGREPVPCVPGPITGPQCVPYLPGHDAVFEHNRRQVDPAEFLRAAGGPRRHPRRRPREGLDARLGLNGKALHSGRSTAADGGPIRPAQSRQGCRGASLGRPCPRILTPPGHRLECARFTAMEGPDGVFGRGGCVLWQYAYPRSQRSLLVRLREEVQEMPPAAIWRIPGPAGGYPAPDASAVHGHPLLPASRCAC